MDTPSVFDLLETYIPSKHVRNIIIEYHKSRVQYIINARPKNSGLSNPQHYIFNRFFNSQEEASNFIYSDLLREFDEFVIIPMIQYDGGVFGGYEYGKKCVNKKNPELYVVPSIPVYNYYAVELD